MSVNDTAAYCRPDHLITFTLPSKKQPSIQKKFIFDPIALKKKVNFLGNGANGAVYRARLKIQAGDKPCKEKQYALKIFKTLKNRSTQEFNCHIIIIEKIEHPQYGLHALGIIPGTGIEKKPLHAFFEPTMPVTNNCLIKKLYDKNLNEAIQEGCFNDKNLLILGSKQLLEGLISLMTIGALYFDIKPSNILVGRNSKFELAFSDFEEVVCLKFKNEIDEEIIKTTQIRMNPYLVFVQDILDLEYLQKNNAPSEKFIKKLHSLYVFILGALFFEMATKMAFRTFLSLRHFTYYLTEKGATDSQIADLWNKCRTFQSGKGFTCLQELINDLMDEMGKTYRGPDEINMTTIIQEQKTLHEYMLSTETPPLFADLVISMLNPDSLARISIYEALEILRTNDNLLKNYSEPTKVPSPTQESKQPTFRIKKRSQHNEFHIVLNNKKQF